MDRSGYVSAGLQELSFLLTILRYCGQAQALYVLCSLPRLCCQGCCLLMACCLNNPCLLKLRSDCKKGGVQTSQLRMVYFSPAKGNASGGDGLPSQQLSQQLRIVHQKATATATVPNQGLLDPVSQKVQQRQAGPCSLLALGGSLSRLNQAHWAHPAWRSVGSFHGRAPGYGNVMAQRK